MSYEPTNWKTGDVVTSAKLNKLENAVASGGSVLKLNFTVDNDAGTITIDKTFAEIKEAILSGAYVFGIIQHGGISNIVYPCSIDERVGPELEEHAVGIGSFRLDPITFRAETENDYPVNRQ